MNLFFPRDSLSKFFSCRRPFYNVKRERECGHKFGKIDLKCVFCPRSFKKLFELGKGVQVEDEPEEGRQEGKERRRFSDQGSRSIVGHTEAGIKGLGVWRYGRIDA